MLFFKKKTHDCSTGTTRSTLDMFMTEEIARKKRSVKIYSAIAEMPHGDSVLIIDCDKPIALKWVYQQMDVRGKYALLFDHFEQICAICGMNPKNYIVYLSADDTSTKSIFELAGIDDLFWWSKFGSTAYVAVRVFDKETKKEEEGDK